MLLFFELGIKSYHDSTSCGIWLPSHQDRRFVEVMFALAQWNESFQLFLVIIMYITNYCIKLFPVAEITISTLYYYIFISNITAFEFVSITQYASHKIDKTMYITIMI